MSQVLAPELNLAISIYFYTDILIIESIIHIVIITISLGNDLISVNSSYVHPLIITNYSEMPLS